MPDPYDSWGRLGRPEGGRRALPFAGAFPAVRSPAGLLPRGNGRSYGDSCLNDAGLLLDMRGASRILAFDPGSGIVEAEPGALLADVTRRAAPAGWFLPVTPGTQFVTLGGALANDVHGKNHHRDGGFGASVEALTLLMPDGTPRVCTRAENAELFRATIGGMGLTGTILEATFRMKAIETGWIRQETRVAHDLAGMLDALEISADSTYSVAWIDCSARGSALGRGLIYRGEHARRRDIDHNRVIAPPLDTRARAIPFDAPAFTLNRASVGAFNALYHRRGRARAGAPEWVPWQSYFFPLDGLSNWNRLYGARGFLQHQCVIPADRAGSALAEILERVARLGSASPLAVLKQLGHGSGLMSFPSPGYTLALDLPATDAAFALLDEIDAGVVAAGGRLYLAKDARQSRATFEAGYPALAAFRALRRDIGAARTSASHLSQRLGI